MRRKLWLLLFLSLFIVGRESYCASNINIPLPEPLQRGFDFVRNFREEHWILSYILLDVPCISLWYWYFDLHQKKEGWYTCKFYYAGGYITKLFYKRIYLDFYYSYFWLACGFIMEKPFSYFFFMNINVRIYRDFYIVFCIPVLFSLQKIFLFFKKKFSSQGDIDNC